MGPPSDDNVAWARHVFPGLPPAARQRFYPFLPVDDSAHRTALDDTLKTIIAEYPRTDWAIVWGVIRWARYVAVGTSRERRY